MNPEMMKALEQVQRMQEEMAKAQEKLKDVTATVEVGGGMVKATANGLQEITSLKLEKEVIDPNEQEMLEDLIVSAVNRAIAKAKEQGDAQVNAVANAMMPKIPGLNF
jgi:DNA-binding YbaB/EbfC family protein